MLYLMRRKDDRSISTRAHIVAQRFYSHLTVKNFIDFQIAGKAPDRRQHHEWKLTIPGELELDHPVNS